MELFSPGIGLIFWGLIGLTSVAVWIFALVDVVRRDFYRQNDKIVWALIILLAPVVGSILYLVIGWQRR